MGEDSSEKTEEPTPHKLREARKKGQIAKSKEFTSAALLLISFYTLKAFAVKIWEQLSAVNHLSLGFIGTEFNGAVAGIVLRESLTLFFKMQLPIFMIIVVATIVLESVQTGFLFSTEALEPKLENLDPIGGFKKLFAMKQIVELIKSVIKMAIVIYLLYIIIRDEYFIIIQSQARNIWLITGAVGRMVMKVVTMVGIAYFFLAILDYFYQKHEFLKEMRMSKKEIKEEYKKLEGDPLVKQRQRQAQQEMSQGRQMGAVPGADVVVTNPIHVAVALKYNPQSRATPYVVAKGKRLIAAEIKKIAEENGVMIIENPPLARSLYKQTKLGQEIPEEHYKVVAELLAFVYHHRNQKKFV